MLLADLDSDTLLGIFGSVALIDLPACSCVSHTWRALCSVSDGWGKCNTPEMRRACAKSARLLRIELATYGTLAPLTIDATPMDVISVESTFRALDNDPAAMNELMSE